MARFFNQNDYQGATTDMWYQGTPSTPQIAQPRLRHNQYPSMHNHTQVPVPNNWETPQFQQMALNPGNPFAMQPPPRLMESMAGAYTPQLQSQPQFAPTMHSQHSQRISRLPSTQPTAYGQQVPSVNYGNPRAVVATREGPHTRYGAEYNYQQRYGPQSTVEGQVGHDSSRYAGYNSNGDRNQNQLFGTQQMSQQQSYIYPQPAPGSFLDQDQTPIDYFGTVPALTDDATVGERDQTLTTNESEVPISQVVAIDEQSAHAMNTATEQVGQSSQSSVEVEAVILNQVGNFVNATAPTPVLASPPQRSVNRKRSAESNSSTSSKKRRAEKRAEKEAEKKRLEAERKAQEPPMSAEDREKLQRFDDICRRVKAKRRVTEDELRVFLPDRELQSIREQFSEMRGINEWSDGELRYRYAFQPGQFKTTHSAWQDQLMNDHVAERNNKRQKRREEKS